MKLGRHEVPDFWQHMLPEEFQWLRAPDEKLATCNDCYNVAIGAALPGCQCCTYSPEIPNFLLGAALGDALSRQAVRAAIAKGHGLPSGLTPTPSVYVRAVVALADESFGMDPDMVCQFMDAKTRQCAVYGYRNSVCSTFFCTHDHDEAGADYWGHVQDLLGRVEVTLAQWAMQQMGFSVDGYIERFDGWATRLHEVESEDGAWSEAARRDLWGEWYGREEAFYQGCAAAAEAQRGQLFDCARRAPMREPLAYERAVRETVPEDSRFMAPQVPDARREDEGRVDDLWYRLKLATRQLWELPFGEGKVTLADGVSIEPTQTRLPVLGCAPCVVRHDDTRLGVSTGEADALRLFETPRELGEELFECTEIAALEDARASLSMWLRRGLLVLRP